MSFYACLIFAVISLCLGGTAGCLLCMAGARLCKKAFLKARISAVCLLLTAAVIAGAAGFVFIKDLTLQLEYLCSDLPFFAAIFAAGLLSAVFWKVFIPLFLVIYIVLASFTGVSLYSKFGVLPDSVSVTLNKNFVEAGNAVFFVDSPAEKSLVVEVYTLPSKLLLPLPRVWYGVIGTVGCGYIDDGSNIRLASGFSGEEALPAFESPEKEAALKKQQKKYLEHILKNRQNLLIPLPEGELLPSVFTLKFRRKDEKLSCRLVKNL